MRIKDKNKKISLVIGISALALTTIGFSTWTISGITGIDNQEVSVSFGEVTSNTLNAQLQSGATQDLNVKFDSVQDSTGTITGNGGEDLSFTIRYQVTKSTASTPFIGLQFTITDAFDALVNGNYIERPYGIGAFDFKKVTAGDYYRTSVGGEYLTSAPTTGVIEHHKVSIDNDALYKFESTFTFKWGATFNHQNPARFDNDGTVTDVTSKLTAFKTEYEKIGKTTQIAVKIFPLDK